MDETKLRTIAQLQEFLAATPEVNFTAAEGSPDLNRYERFLRAFWQRSAWCNVPPARLSA